MNRGSFTVDAALLQELGERLIGRAHIALAEMIKNAYDADANNCHITFESDRIVIDDDGHGMSESDFLDHWMRIGTPHKTVQATSKRLKRALTGSKGIGRLSAQFLASEMTLESTAADGTGQTLYALVDWTKIRHGESLDTVEVLWQMQDDQPEYPGGWRSGTRIELKGLKSEWDSESLEELGREVWTLRPPFSSPRKRSGARTAEDFDIQIDAPKIRSAKEAFDTMRSNLFNSWKARIEGRVDGGRRDGKASVTVEFLADYPKGAEEGAIFNETITLPVRKGENPNGCLIDRMKFEILIFRPVGPQPGGIQVGDLREYLTRFGNVSVYDAGFRLPYYGSGGDRTGQDWLNMAVDQGRRLSASQLLPEHLKMPERYMEDLPAPGRLFGAVEIDTGHERLAGQAIGASDEEWLQIQSSRDRLQANPAFSQLRDLVRFSLDFYANRHRRLSLLVAEKRQPSDPPSRNLDRVMDILDRNKDGIPKPVYQDMRRELKASHQASKANEALHEQQAVLLAPLATAGMTALALSHELARESRLLGRAKDRLSRIATAQEVPELDRILQDLGDLRQRLDGLRELFAPLLSETDTAATERLKVRPVVEQVVRSMRPILPRVEFDINGISPALRFPVGSFAEWSAILQNALSNAWNAMLDSDRAEISFEGDRSGARREWLRVNDTGKGLGMTLEETEDLFAPFERRLEISSDNQSIAIGGQGLGLTIARMIARRRKAQVRFVKPTGRFSTSFEISWRGAEK